VYREENGVAKSFLRKEGFRQRSGFSLIVVLIISLIGLAVMGATMQFAVSSGGSVRVNSALAVKYNLLQGAVEEGRALLMESMDNESDPHKYTDNGIAAKGADITSVDMLLLTDSPDPGKYSGVTFPLGHAITRPMNRHDLARMGIFGESGVLTVRIYDMRYEPTLIKISDEEELQLLPPSMLNLGEEIFNKSVTTLSPEKLNDGGGGGDSDDGAYLIRAELSVNGILRPWRLETSIIQANNK
jgi:hypothetical protein